MRCVSLNLLIPSLFDFFSLSSFNKKRSCIVALDSLIISTRQIIPLPAKTMAIRLDEEGTRHVTLRGGGTRTRSFPWSSLYVTGIFCFLVVALNLRGGFVLLFSNEFSASHSQRDLLSAASDVPRLPDRENVHRPKSAQSLEIAFNLHDLQPSKNETIVVGLANEAYAPVAVFMVPSHDGSWICQSPNLGGRQGNGENV